MSGAGPEAAVELFCEIADDIRLMLREVKQTNELLAGIADELRKGRRSVADGQAEVAHGRERLLEAIQSGDENTNRIIGSVESLIDELRRNR
jgi:methyl-accepting chemotaxis protein